jgi:hypothetical protein
MLVSPQMGSYAIFMEGKSISRVYFSKNKTLPLSYLVHSRPRVTSGKENIYLYEMAQLYPQTLSL